MKIFEIWYNGSRDHTVELEDIPSVGSLVCTNAYFNYRILDIHYMSDSNTVRLIADREF